MRSKSCRLLALAAAVASTVALLTGIATSQPREPVYVGARVCGECHAGAAAGHQFSIWRRSAHARAYASLAMPESPEIARRSGIPEPPHQARVCLGCHATAADAEDWERDATFLIEDGIQCEACHGPGSEYIGEEIMRNRELAIERGLRIPDANYCRVCHGPKGSHEAVLGPASWEFDSAIESIGHPRPEAEPDAPPSASEKAEPPLGPSPQRFTGVRACASCHSGPQSGFQASQWRMSLHARAWAVLSTPEAFELARSAEVSDPQTSPACLSCHATGAGFDSSSFSAGFDVRDGVQCESCHGAGGDYSTESIMRDPGAASAAGLRPQSEEICLPCHQQGHSGQPFDYQASVARIAHPTSPPGLLTTGEPQYKTPVNLTVTPDGREVWVACEASATTIVVDTATAQKVAEIEVGGQPHDVTFSPDGSTAYVTNRLDDSLSVVDVASREVVRTVPAGDEPHGVLTDASGSRVFILNSGQDSISVLDAETLNEVKRLSASRVPWSLALSPDGETLLVTNTLSRFTEPRTPPMSEVTVLELPRVVVRDRVVVPETNLLQGIAWHPSGDYAVVTMNRTKNLVPMTRLLQGWTITNGIAIVWKDGRVDQVLLDGPGMAFPDAADVTVTPDGRYALVTSSGSNRLAMVDLERLTGMLEAAPDEERERVFPNHLGKSADFIEGFVATGASPRGVAVSPDGRTAYVANALDDSVTAVALDSRMTQRIDLGGPTEISQTRRGEILFHSANIAFRRQFSCHTCHPDGHVDGITYDIEPDGIGLDPVDNRSLRGIFDTAPFKWTGLNRTLQRQCGPRLAVFFTRLAPFSPQELAALEVYITTIPRPPNRHRALGAPLTEAQRAGRKIFERTHANDGRRLEPTQRCINCHPAPLYTDRQKHDVGTKGPLDRSGEFDTPHLTNIYDSAPYLHDGRSRSLEEIWTVFNPYDQHGATNDLTKDQLNQLIEYLKTL